MTASDTQRSGTLTGSRSADQLIAGIGAGAMSTLALHPLDLVKTRFQGSRASCSAGRPVTLIACDRLARLTLTPLWLVHDGQLSRDQLPVHSRPKGGALQMFRFGLFTLDYMRKIAATQGLRGCYQGLSANLAASVLSWGSYFLLYDHACALPPCTLSLPRYSVFKDYASKKGERPLGSADFFLASVSAGFVAVLISNPFWLMKTRLCLQSRDRYQSTRYRGLVDGLATVLKTEGVRGLYRGLVPGLIGISHGGVQFVVYEALKRRPRAKAEASASFGTADYVAMSCTSKLAATTLTYPYQVARSRLQDCRGDSQGVMYRGLGDVIRRTWRWVCMVRKQCLSDAPCFANSNEGPLGFYKGLGPNLARVLPGTCITFVVYEQISGYCQRQPPKAVR